MNSIHRIALFAVGGFITALSFWATQSLISVSPDEPSALAQPPGTQAQNGHSKGGWDGVGIRGRVAFRQWNRSGRLSGEGWILNTVHDFAKNAVLERIVFGGSPVPYDGIGAVDSERDSPENGILATNVAQHLDGDADTPGNQNPADGEIETHFESEPGRGAVRVTFRARADGVTVRQIVLTKGAPDDTLDGSPAIEPEDIFAFVDVPNVSLNTGDTVEYTWSIDVD